MVANGQNLMKMKFTILSGHDLQPRMGSKSKVKNGSEYLSRILINIHPHFHGIPLDNDGCKPCSDKNGDGKYG